MKFSYVCGLDDGQATHFALTPPTLYVFFKHFVHVFVVLIPSPLTPNPGLHVIGGTRIQLDCPVVKLVVGLSLGHATHVEL